MTDPERIAALTQSNAELRAALRLGVAQIRWVNFGTRRETSLMKLLWRVYSEARRMSGIGHLADVGTVYALAMEGLTALFTRSFRHHSSP